MPGWHAEADLQVRPFPLRKKNRRSLRGPCQLPVEGVMEVPILAKESIQVVIIFIQGLGSIIFAMALM